MLTLTPLSQLPHLESCTQRGYNRTQNLYPELTTANNANILLTVFLLESDVVSKGVLTVLDVGSLADGSAMCYQAIS